jgi:hypothetical protein
MSNSSDGTKRIDRRTVLRGAAGAATSGLIAGALPGGASARSAPLPRARLVLAGIEARWGPVRVDGAGEAIDMPGGISPLFPHVARLPVSFPAEASDWYIAASVESTLDEGAKALRRDIEDVALSLADGRVQLWLGGRRTLGARLLVYGRTVATASVFLPPPGEPARLELTVAGGGHLVASANGTLLPVQQRLFAEP